MPRYVYRCDSCNEEFQIMHSIKDTLSVCKLCGQEGSLTRIPQMTIGKLKQPAQKRKVGAVVDEYIADANQQLKEYKKNLKEDKRT